MGTAHKARRTGIPGTPTFLFRPLTMLCLLFSKISLHQRSFTRKWLQILMELKSRAIKAQMVTPVQRFVYRPHVSSKACDNVVNGVIRHTVYILIQAPAIFLNTCFRFWCWTLLLSISILQCICYFTSCVYAALLISAVMYYWLM